MRCIVATLQVKSIDDKLYELLGRRAAMENRSISQEVIAILKAHLSKPNKKDKQSTEYFLELCGHWVDERSDEELINDIRTSRETISTHRNITL